MMATRLSAVCRAFFILSCFSAGFVQSAFPVLNDITTTFYTTEVQVTDVIQGASVYAIEYYNNIDDQGSLRLHFQGDLRSIYYDNSSYQITEVVDNNCTTTDEDISDYDYYPIYYGWLNKNPLVIGPSAPLWYAQSRRDLVKDAGEEEIRGIYCDKYELPVVNKRDNLTIEYFFTTKGWDTPYKHEKLQTPVRIRVSGVSSRYSANAAIFVPVDIINDFAYFRPTVLDDNSFLPPIGLGCKGMEETDDFPDIPEVFQYSAEVVNLLQGKEQEDIEIKFERVWYDHPRLIARLDKFTKQSGYGSTLYDFNTGTMYKALEDGTCKMDTLKGSDFKIIAYSETNRMKDPKEFLRLDGEFYEMGKRDIRGLTCDAYENVKFDEEFNGKKYHKLVTTVYFTQLSTKVGVNGEEESRIPIYFLVNGYSTPEKKTLQLQYNIFEFNDVIWPEMYSSFKLEKCFTKPESKAYFVLILEVSAKTAAIMEDQDAIVVSELRGQISKHAKVPDMRIPFLKVDYKTSGVYATGFLLERPPAFLQFIEMFTGNTVTHDPHLKTGTGKNVEECSYECVDQSDITCKGFYLCNNECFLKSTDMFEDGDESSAVDLGYCTWYKRAEIDSSNFRQAYLKDALQNLETAVLNKSIAVEFQIPNAEEVVTVKDIVIGEGPYIGVDSGDKPFSVSVEYRKLNRGAETTKFMEYAGTLHDCYKRCKEAGSQCASFSFCPDSTSDNKECMISSDVIIKGVTKDDTLIPDRNCNIYDLKFADYFIEYPEKVSLLGGDKVITNVETRDDCAKNCVMETEFKCRGFEYCKSVKTCTLHKKHILDLKPGETAPPKKGTCTHYAARYLADYMDMGPVLVDDKSDVRTGISLEDCAKVCSEELRESCNSFNFCPDESLVFEGSCALSSKLLRDDGVPLDEDFKCSHYEKRDTVHDWDNAKTKSLSANGYTKKGFAGLVIGMLALGLIVGALAFVLYSYMKSRSSGEGMAVRFMKNET